jgi:hypothetical protein
MLLIQDLLVSMRAESKKLFSELQAEKVAMMELQEENHKLLTLLLAKSNQSVALLQENKLWKQGVAATSNISFPSE